MKDIYGPCHCGSGKKYKWCCMPADRLKATQETALATDEIQGQLTAALTGGSHTEILAIIAKMRDAKRLYNLDALNLLTERLIYNNMGELALTVMQESCGAVMAQSAMFDWAKEDFQNQLAAMMMLDYFQRHGNNSLHLLSTALGTYGNQVEEEQLVEVYTCLSGWREQTVKIEQFYLADIDDEADEIPDETAERFLRFGYEFVGYAGEVAHVNWYKAYFAVVEIISYLIDRACGILDDREDPAAHGHAASRLYRDGRFFCPDCVTMLVYLQAKLFSQKVPAHHAAAMILEILPHWISFLVECKLINQQQADSTWKSLQNLRTSLDSPK